jgi:hypothetical protein
MFHIIYYYHFNAADGVAPQRSTHSRGGGFVFSAALKTLQARMVIVPARFEDRNNIDALNALDEEIPTCTHPRPSALSRACRVGSSALTCVEIVPGPLGVALNLKKYPNLKHVVNTGEQFYRGESPPPPKPPTYASRRSGNSGRIGSLACSSCRWSCCVSCCAPLCVGRRSHHVAGPDGVQPDPQQPPGCRLRLAQRGRAGLPLRGPGTTDHHNSPPGGGMRPNSSSDALRVRVLRVCCVIGSPDGDVQSQRGGEQRRPVR